MRNPEDDLRNVVKGLLKERGISDGQFARDMGLTKVWASKWLRKGVGSVPVKKLGSLSDYFAVQVSDLFSPAPKSSGMPGPVTALRTDRTSTQKSGDVADGSPADQIGSLKRQLAERDSEIRSLHIALAAIADELHIKLHELARTPRENIHGAGKQKPTAR